MGRFCDIYFEEAWQQLYAQRQGMRLDSVRFACDAGEVCYGFLRRPVELRSERQSYEDIVTPYAFSGPYLAPREDSASCRRALAQQFDAYFQKYCEDEGIVAEYVQFSPWLKNHEAFEGLYRLECRSHIVAIDLTKPDLLMDELDARRRRSVRDALKKGVQIRYDGAGEMIDEFLRLYEFTIQKYHANHYYRFDRAFLREMFRRLPGGVRFAYAVHEGRCASICLLLQQGDYVHYHLAGNDPACLSLNASSLLIYDVARTAQQEGRKLFVLGGAEGAMLEFKRTFTRSGFYEYFSGKRIRNQAVYDRLVAETGTQHSAYFPAYRDDGRVEFMNWRPTE